MLGKWVMCREWEGSVEIDIVVYPYNAYSLGTRLTPFTHTADVQVTLFTFKAPRQVRDSY